MTQQTLVVAVAPVAAYPVETPKEQPWKKWMKFFEVTEGGGGLIVVSGPARGGGGGAGIVGGY